MTTATHEQITVDQATTEHQKAVEIANELEARLIDGDTDITQTMLADAGEAVKYSQLRVHGAESAAKRAEEQDRQEKATALRTEIVQSFGETTGQIEKARTESIKSLTRLAMAVRNHNLENGSLYARVEELRPRDVPLDAPLPADLNDLTKVDSHRVPRFAFRRLALGALHTAADVLDSRDLSRPDAEYFRDLAVANLEEARILQLIAETANAVVQEA